MTDEIVTVKVLKDDVEIAGVLRGKDDLVDAPKTEADILEKSGVVEKTKKEAATEEAPEVEDLGEGDVWEEIDRELNEKQEKELPPKWAPADNGDQPPQIRGEVLRLGPDNYGKTLIIEDLNGNEWFIPSGRKALESFMKRAEPGNKVGLRYTGETKSEESGRTYQNYRTVIK